MCTSTERKVLFEQACDVDDMECLLECMNSLEDVFKVHYALCEGLAPLTEADKACIREIALATVEEKRQAHCSPWWREGLKADIKAMGFAVEENEVLDEFFGDEENARRATQVIRDNGPEAAAQKVENGEVFDDAHRGNFAGFSARLILSSWRRLRII